MTQRRRTSKAKVKRRFGRRAFLAGAGAAACAAAGWYLRQKSDADRTAVSGQDTPPAPNPALPAGGVAGGVGELSGLGAAGFFPPRTPSAPGQRSCWTTAPGWD